MGGREGKVTRVLKLAANLNNMRKFLPFSLPSPLVIKPEINRTKITALGEKSESKRRSCLEFSYNDKRRRCSKTKSTPDRQIAHPCVRIHPHPPSVVR